MSTLQSQFVQFLIALAVAGVALYIGYLLSSRENHRGMESDTRKDNEEGNESYAGFRHISSFELPIGNFSLEKDPENVITQRFLPMIETKALRKTFVSKKKGKAGTVEAVRGIDFSVARGEIFGLLGPNGAGKTTTMRMLSTLLTPTSGSALIDGKDVASQSKEVRKIIGYVSQVGGMQRESTGRENLLLQAKLYGMSRQEAVGRVNEIIELLELGAFADRKTSTYSGGQRRMFDLASGIIHRPVLLFLDEPSTGLDPQNRVQVWEQVKKLHREGTTIFVTTHYLEEADALCDRVAIVDRGGIVAIGSPQELKRHIAGDIISLTFASATEAAAAAEAVQENSFITEIQRKDASIHLFVDSGNENLPIVMQALHEHQISASTVALSRPTLDDVFLKLTGRSMKE